MKDGETVRFGLNDRFGSSPIVVMDGASVPGQAQGQTLTDEQAAEIAWIEMARDLSTAWSTPAQRPTKDHAPQRTAQDQAAWVGQGPAPMIHGQQGSGSGQVLQDDDPAATAHQAMIAHMCNAWRKR